MRHLLFIVFLVAAILTAGCAGGDQKPAATPTPQLVSTTVPASPAPVVTATAKISATPVTTPATFVIASPVTTVTDTLQRGYRTYTNKDYRFTIQHPESWTASGEGITAAGNVKKYLVTFTDPALKSKQEITITPDTSGLSLEEWAKIFVNQLKADSSVIVVSQDPVQVDGVPAKKVVYIYGTGENALEYTIILVVNGNNSYYMEFASRKNDYPEYSKEADRMINTVRFT